MRMLTRKTKLELLTADSDICLLIFNQKRAQHACRLFLTYLKGKNGLTRVELSRFSWDLQRGKIEQGFKYGRGSFYSQVRRTLLGLGLIAVEQRFSEKEIGLSPERSRQKDVVDKYVAVRQPITKRPPDGLNLVRIVWQICDAWNKEFTVVEEVNP